MKLIRLTFAACLAIALSAASAQEDAKETTPPASAARSTSIGYVDIDRVTGQAKAVNSAMAGIQDKVKKYQEEIDQKRKKIRDLEEDVRRTEGILAKDEQDAKRKEINRLKNELDELDMQARREMQRLDDTFFAPLLKKIVFAIQDVAQEKDIDLVLRGEAVLYGRDSVDLTDAVIRKLNVEERETSPSRKVEERLAPEKKSSSAASSAEETPASRPRPAKTPATRPVDRQSE